jgi:hypothetical protein
MSKKIHFLIFLAFFGMGEGFRVFAGANVEWKNQFTFYGDNTEFFEPFRTGETILGQQGKSFLEAAVGPQGLLRAGIFADFRAVTEPQVSTKPLLSFEYRVGGTRLILGTIDNGIRHGFLEPLAVTTLEFTRPIEYGIQVIQQDDTFRADLFINWHQLNTPVQPETLDYGGTLRRSLDDHLNFEFQFHGYHEGGQLYSVAFRNNWAPALGFRWKAPAGDWGTLRLAAFGLTSGDLGSPVVADTRWGQAGYLRFGVQPHWLPELFFVGWKAKDFYFKEGDFNYSSYDATQSFYRQDRTYIEVGLGGDLPLGGGVVLNSEARVHWIDEFFAVSSRHAVRVPFDLPLFSGTDDKEKKAKHEDHKP